MPMPRSDSAFDGFPRQTFNWFAGLRADNSKAYFTSHRDVYERVVRGSLEMMLERLADEFGGGVKMFRQNRDVRFSADKSPYKTTTYGLVVGRPDSLAALYAQLSAEGLFAGTGYYQLAADQLSRFRAAIADDTRGPRLEKAVDRAKSSGLKIFGGEALKTAPRGYSRDHPRVQLLRHKGLVAGRRLEPTAHGITPDAALEHSRTAWTACAPLNAWLDEHVGASEIPPRGRYGGGR